jgi:lipopolysaccharide transport system ATP-binding protein
VRLAFAVAAHLDPEILVVDEVLAVGDAAFQRKCLAKMESESRRGRTVLFVSHNMAAIRALCTRAVLLRAGRIVSDGPVEDVVTEYIHRVGGEGAEPEWNFPGDDAPGGAEMRIRRLRLTAERATGTLFAPDQAITVAIEYELLLPVRGLVIEISLLTESGDTAFAGTDYAARKEGTQTPGRYESRCTIPAGLLNRTGYVLRLRAFVVGVRALVQAQDLARFTVDGKGNEGAPYAHTWPGAVTPRLDWQVRRL